VKPANATNQDGTWTSSDEAVATIDANGLVTGLKAGETTITATTVDGGYRMSTVITVTAVNALRKLSDIKSMVVSTYQAVSGAGAAGPVELENEVKALAAGESYQPKVFSYQIAYNVIPQIGGEEISGYTSEEMKLQNEGRKIMHLPEMNVSCTCVRVPVVRSHSISAQLVFDRPISVEEARAAIAAAPGVKLVDDLDALQYPMPLDTQNQDLVFVGRIRPDLTNANGLCLWCCGDQIRKGAATNAIQIAELLISREA
jgi:aspartate-semialdehyde dehydrogenase